MLKRKNFSRPKVNCYCRCTPQRGIIVLYPPMVESSVEEAMEVIQTKRSTSVIAATAVRVGQMLENTGHNVRALSVYTTAVNRILRIDWDRAEDYYAFGPLPPNPHYRPWSARINDADALEVAKPLDALYHRMHMPGYAHEQRRINVYYEGLFRSVYSACM